MRIARSEADGVLGMGDGLAMAPAPAVRDARLPVGELPVGVEPDRRGGGEQRAVGVVIGQLGVAQTSECIEVVGIVVKQRTQPSDRLGQRRVGRSGVQRAVPGVG